MVCGRAGLTIAAHAKAQRLAASIKHAVRSTKLESIRPLPNGGLELRTSHTTGAEGAKPARISVTAQVYPHHLSGSPRLQRVLETAHRGLTAVGAKPGAIKHPPIAATFSRD